VKIEDLPLADLKPYENNPRDNDKAVDAVAASINEFGFKIPIIIDSDNIIIAGHTRLKAAQKLGLKTAPCIRADDLTAEQAKAFRLADNKTAELAEWDFEKLNAEIAGLPDFDLTLFGFDADAVADLEAEIVEDETPESPEPRAKPGDMWRLGDHRLICGDSTDGAVVSRLCGGGQVDLLLTDPPYNVAVGSTSRPWDYNKNNVRIKNDDMPSDEFVAFLRKALSNAADAMKAGAAFYVFHADSTFTSFEKAIQSEKSLHVSNRLIWVKANFVMGRFDYQLQHEPIIYGWKSGAAHYFVDSRTESSVIEDSNGKLSTMKKSELIALVEKLRGQTASSVIRGDKTVNAALHPTIKPQDVLTYLIKNSSRRGDRVLDLFGGSGSTLIACEQTGRRCFMAELDEHYCDVIIQRWENLTGQTAELISE
jgi:site-specific DNA-methyltransferase (adenine-specific)